jgi:glycosyltransferase involved in cell wall biosynthesis
MKTLDHIQILIPAYMPSQKLITLTRTLLTMDFAKIIVVDDGSGRDYRNIFRGLPSEVCLLHHPNNRGKGRAIKTGLSYIAELCPDCLGIVVCDADGQHTPADIRKVAMEYLAHPNALILGSRTFDKDVPARSAFGNSVTRSVYYLASHVKLGDTQTGLRAFSFEMLPWLIALPGERYDYEINMLLEAARKQIPIREIKIQTVYFNKNKDSHFKTIRDSVIVYKTIFKFSLSSLFCFGLDFILLFFFNWLTASSNDTASLLFAVIGARTISSFVNYTLNKNMVFQRQGKNAIIKYYLLAAGILAANYGLMHTLYLMIGIPLFWAKIITELILFTVSFTVQKKLIFIDRKVLIR